MFKKLLTVFLCVVLSLTHLTSGGYVSADEELSALDTQIIQEADTLFLNNSNQIGLGAQARFSNPVEAGDIVQYYITYAYSASPSRTYDFLRTYFDEYIENQLIVTLPEGLHIASSTNGINFVKDSSLGTNTYVARLADTDSGASEYDFTLNLYVEGNGTADAIRSFNLEDAITFTSSFWVKNKVRENNPVNLKKYTQTTTADMGTIITESLDVWGVEKSVVGNPVVSRSDMKATVTYKIEVGIMQGSVMLKTVDDYDDMKGRDAFDTIDGLPYAYLTDDLTAFVKSNQTDLVTPISPSSVQIKKGTNGTPVTLTENANTYLNGSLALNNKPVDSDGDGAVDQDVPCYTDYYVVAEYPLTSDLIEHFENPNRYLDFHNDVGFTYKLAKKTADEDDASAGKTGTLPVNSPAKVSIEKWLEDYQGNNSRYQNTPYGAITYRISSANGETFKLYEKIDDNTYRPLTGYETAKASHDIQAGVTYYITAGIQYRVEEVLTSEQSNLMALDTIRSTGDLKTPTEGENWTVKFQNVEKAGSIVITKVDDNGYPVENAEFKITYPDRTTQNLFTNASGLATIAKALYGDYTIEEVSAPDGYSITFAPQTITVNANQRYDVSAENLRTYSTISLTKYVGIAEAVSSMSRATTSFGGAFTLERSTDRTTWTTVTTDIHGNPISQLVNSSGQIVAEVDAFDSSANTYYYRFKESIPDGYYDPANLTATTAYSDEVTLVDNGHAKTTITNVDMYNRQKISITIDKTFWDVNSSRKLTKNNNKTTTVSLYRYDGTTMTQVGNSQTAGSATWNNLPAYDGNTKIDYYVSEVDVDRYKLDEDSSHSSGDVVTIDGVKYIPVAVTAKENSQTLYNIEQVIPVTVHKRDYYTNQEIANCYFTVTSNGNSVNDAKDGTPLTNILIPTTGSKTIYLTAGYSYDIVETAYPANYIQQSATDSEPIVVDLIPATFAQIVYTTDTVPFKSVIIYNYQNPIVRTTKKDSSTGNTSDTLKTARFEVYTLSGSTYTPVLDDSGNKVVIYDQSTVRLAPGEYYLKESVVPTGYLDPSLTPSLYQAKYANQYYVGTDETGNTVTFLKATVKNGPRNTTTKVDNICELDVFNISNTGGIVVKKYVDGVLTAVPNFPVVIKKNGVVVKTGKTNSSGKATITGLEVYNADGTLVQYTVEEGDLGTDFEAYYKVPSSQQVTLTAGQNVDTDVNGQEIRIDNKTYITIQAQKVYRRTWEFWFTHKSYPASGSVVGLFHQTASGDWERISVVETEDSGAIDFSNLVREDTYALVELSCSDPNLYPYDDNGNEKRYAGENTTLIPDALLGNYLYKKLTPADMSASQIFYDLGQLVNQDHWVQFEIAKYRDTDSLDDQNQQIHDTNIDYDKDTLFNNAIYKLYRYTLSDGQSSVVFDTETASGWDEMGTYATGSMYYDNGERATGRFRTNVDQDAGQRVVYMLVEVNKGPGSALLNPNFKYTFYQPNGQNYSVTLTGEDSSYPIRNRDYYINNVNFDDLLNSRPSGGGGILMMANVRIAKWMDDFDENGNPKEDYKPIPNVSFDLYLDPDCTKLLETLTVGLDNDLGSTGTPKAWAQSSTYKLSMSDADNTTGVLTNYTHLVNGNPETTTVNVVRLRDRAIYGNYDVFGVKIYIKESNVPKGYYLDTAPRQMYLCFINSDESVEAFNDAYFVTDADAEGPTADSQISGYASRYVTWEDSSGAIQSWGEEQYRIVNYPIQDTKVLVKSLGYVPFDTPEESTLNKTGEQLEAMNLDSRVPISGAQFSLYRFNDSTKKFETYNYMDKQFSTQGYTFKTRVDGSYMFAKGLPMGKYMIVQNNLGTFSDYKNNFISNTTGKIFTVGGQSMEVDVYNPKKPSLTVYKKNINGDLLSNVTFDLLKVSSTGSTTVNGSKTTTSNGKVTFNNLENGTYILAETSTGYPVTYIDEYFAGEEYLYDLVTDGTLIGYEVSDTPSSSSSNSFRDRVITSIGMNDQSAVVTVVDPEFGSLTLKKVDEDDANKTLANAKFQMYYKTFDAWKGTISVTNDGWSGWTKKDIKTTNTNGLISLTGLEPGIYAFYETAAPANYSILKDINGKDMIYYVVVKGGMDVTVTGLPTTQTISGDPSNVTVQTFYDSSATVIALNRAQVNMAASKYIDAGLMDADELTWQVRLDLYAAATGGNPIGSATLSNTNPTNVEFKNGTNSVYLTQGQTYYVQETILSTPATAYRLKEVKINNQASTAVGNRYPFVAQSSNAVNVEVTNTYMGGVVYFSKVDTDNRSIRLSGAEFRVYNGTGSTLISGATVTELLNDQNEGTGVYMATIPLSDLAAETFVIKETKAPTDYVMQSGVELQVTLSPENNVIDWRNSITDGEVLTNKHGWNLVINKYANIYSAALENQSTAASGDSTFTLYHYNTTTNAWEFVSSQQNDAIGKVQWVLLPENKYAFAETDYRSTKYSGMDGMYDSSDTLIADGSYTDITVNNQTIHAYVIESMTENLTYSVYNKPYVSIKVVVDDIGDYPVNAKALATYKIYKLDSALPENKAQALAIINGLTDDDCVYATGNANTAESGTNRSYELWSQCDPTEHYVIVQTGVASRGQEDYDTFNKDDNRVVWYQEVLPLENPNTTAVREYVLGSIFSEASVELTKTVINNETALTVEEAADTENAAVNDKIDSLMKGDRKIVYEIDANVTSHNQPLSNFVISEEGIAFDDATTGYSIDSIVVGKATQNIDYFVNPVASNVISAKVTWLDGDGNTISTTTIVSLENEKELTAPNGTKKFNIEYFSEGVTTANSAYKLGYDFDAEPITVDVTIDQQPNGTTENWVKEISGFTSTASVDLDYPKWKADGSGTVPAGNTDSDDAVITVNKVTYPSVVVEKQSNPADKVEVGNDITYTITIRNTSHTEEFVNPIILDTLPTGVTFKSLISVSDGHLNEHFELPEENIRRFIGEPTFTNPTSSGSLVVGDSETAIMFTLNGTLLPDSWVTLTFSAYVDYSAILYGSKLYNYVYVSTAETKYHTEENKHGYFFTNETGEFPTDLPSVAAALGSTATRRETGLHDVLGNYADDETKDFVWISNSSEVPVTMKASMTLTKAIWGDRNTGFRSDDGFLATASRTNSTVSDDAGWVDFRLTTKNGTKSDKYYLVLGDVIPGRGDSLGSKWNLELTDISFVSFNDATLTEDDYTIYYYLGSREDALYYAGASYEGALIDALEDANEWQDPTVGWGLNDANIHENWISKEAAEADSDFDMKDVTAFIILFNSNLALSEDKNIIVIYHTEVEDIPDEGSTIDFSTVAFENSNNNFRVDWEGSYQIMTSNDVKVVLMDGNVAVAGDLWIDEDWDATQGTKTAQRDYSDYAIIQNLINNLKFSIRDERDNPSAESADQGGTNTGDNGESIKHFYFEDLGAAVYVPEKGYDLYVSENLNRDALKSSDPYIYSVVATLSNSNLRDIFKITNMGATAYISDDPLNMPNDAIFDNNFYEVSNGVYQTKKFYLRYADEVIDQTKDIGFKMERDLEITKLADDDASTMVKGAQFTISGPFEEGHAVSGQTPLKFVPVYSTSDPTVIVAYNYDPENGTVSTLVTGNDGKIVIRGLNWWKEYVIKETQPAHGYLSEGIEATADSSVGTVITDLATNEWVLNIPATSKITKTDKVTVTNVRKVEVTPVAEKILVNVTDDHYDLTSGLFTFGLYDQNMNLLETKTNDTDGKVTFSTQTYYSEGTHVFFIQEIIPDDDHKIGGMTYSDEIISQTIVVQWDSTDEELKATSQYANKNGQTVDSALFTNTYEPTPTDVELSVHKIISIVKPDVNKKFTFTLTPTEDGNPMPSKSQIEVYGDNEGSFGSIHFTNSGEYNYTIQEQEENYTGYQYDTKAYPVKITVVNDNGKLIYTSKIDGVESQILAVTNPYEPNPTTVNLPVVKTIEGTERVTKKIFQFTITADDSAYPMPQNSTIEIEDEGNAAFGPITYTRKGTYTYVVEEKDTDEGGYVYDTKQYHVTVNVTDNDGNLEAVWSTAEGEALDEDGNMFFENEYSPEAGHVTLSVRKSIVDHIRVNRLKKTFTFTLATEESNTPMPNNMAERSTTVSVVDEGTAAFGEIEYKHQGTYHYTITEVTTNPENNYQYDTTVYNVTVDVVDTNGVMVPTTTMQVAGKTAVSTTEAAFTNHYNPTPVTQQFSVKKIVEGHARNKDQEKTFTFTLTALDGAPMGNNSTSQAITITDEGTNVFDEITYVNEGVYKYTIVETDGKENKYVYDDSIYDVTVTVTDNDGVMEAVTTMQVRGEEDVLTTTQAEFTNLYDPDPTDMIIGVKKIIEDHERVDRLKKTFTFTMVPGDDNTPMPGTERTAVITILDEGTEYFDKIDYTEEGVYEYEIFETIGNENKYTYDTTHYTVVVTVTDMDGVMTAETTVGGAKQNVVEFTNHYNPDSTTQQFSVKKTVIGHERTENLKKTFTFTLTALNGAPMGVTSTTETVTTLDEGEENFTSITYAHEGVYKYTIQESVGNEANYIYDTSIYDVTVTVTDNNGVMEAVTEMQIRGETTVEETTQAEFVNEYNPEGTSKQLGVKKTIVDHERVERLKKTFTFTLSTTETNAPMPGKVSDRSVSVQTTDEETVYFAPFTLDVEGTFHYTLKETVVKAENKYSYDETEHAIVIEVKDNDGTMTATMTIDGEEGNLVEFINHYNPDSTTQQFSVEKQIDGHDRNKDLEKTFTFTLTSLNGAPMGVDTTTETVTVVDEGTEEFTEITYVNEGVYKYTITETIDNEKNYTYDTSIYDVTVTVTDNDGIMEAVTTMQIRGEEDVLSTTKALFVNEYHPTADEVVLSVKKTIVDHERVERLKKTFTFTLSTTEANAPMPNGMADRSASITTVDEDTVDFDAMTFADEGVFHYTISETVITAENSYEYDDTVYDVIITVVDNDGEMVATTEINDVETTLVEFVNHYNPVLTTQQFSVEKQIEGKDRNPNNLKTFTFTLTALNGAPMGIDSTTETITVEDEGTEVFSEITYVNEGVYKYTITEADSKANNYTYDTSIYDVTVTVTDNDGVMEAVTTMQVRGTDDVVTTTEALFVNEYHPTPATVDLTVHKVIEGNVRNRDYLKTFTFVLTPEIDTNPMPADAVDTLTVEDIGTVHFDTITFEDEGEFKYTITEVLGSETGYECDDTIYNVVITTTDDDGTMLVTTVINEVETNEVTFTNQYHPTPTSYTFEAEKKLQNMRLGKDMFTFTLLDSEGEVLQEVGNNLDGSVVFETIEYTEAGVYTYLVKEVIGRIDRMEWDYTEFVVVVTVTDNDGVLSCESDLTEPMVFRNKYIPRIPGTSDR